MEGDEGDEDADEEDDELSLLVSPLSLLSLSLSDVDVVADDDELEDDDGAGTFFMCPLCVTKVVTDDEDVRDELLQVNLGAWTLRSEDDDSEADELERIRFLFAGPGPGTCVLDKAGISVAARLSDLFPLLEIGLTSFSSPADLAREP